MKKLIAVIAALSLLLCVFAGCGKSTVEYYDEEETAASAAETAAEEPADPDAAEAAEPAEETEPAEQPVGIGQGGTGFETFPADMVVATVNGTDVTWMEYYYWLDYYTSYVIAYAGQYGVIISDWNANDLSSTETNAEVILMNAKAAITQDHVIRSEAEKQGIAFDEADEAEIADLFDRNADSMVGDGDGTATDEEKADFLVYLSDVMHIDRDYFDDLVSVSLLSQKLFEAQYGKEGADYSDEDTLAFAEDNNVLAAKHILLATVDTTTREALSEEEIAEKRQRAEDLYAELSALVDDAEALEARFDELTAEYTDDTGYAAYPDGYVFGEGEMVQEFEDAVKAMEIGALSEIVESDYGYHIILRIPIDPDAVIGTDSYGNDVTLRYAAATQQFSAELTAWEDAAEVVWSEGFETPDLPAIFG